VVPLHGGDTIHGEETSEGDLVAKRKRKEGRRKSELELATEGERRKASGNARDSEDG